MSERTRHFQLLVVVAAVAVAASACPRPFGATENTFVGGCSDLVDNDGDGLTDCVDPDCASDPACMAMCGNGTCEVGEDMTNCPADCTGGPVCGNGTCEAGEDLTSCPADCSVGPACGNGICEAGEDMTNCPSDCTGGPVCGNGVCEIGEDSTSCSADCMGGAVCGNGICEIGENSGNCLADCPASGCTTVADMVSQAGCVGQNCTIIDMAGNLGCAPVGATPDYAACDGSEPCMAGAECFGPGMSFICMPFCDLTTGTGCPGGGLCIYQFDTAVGPVGLCDLPDMCFLLGASCGAGEACYIVSGPGDTSCVAAGTVGAGGSCMFINDCIAGHACVGIPGTCAPYCDLTAPVCPTGTCMDFGGALPAPNQDVGACQ